MTPDDPNEDVGSPRYETREYTPEHTRVRCARETVTSICYLGRSQLSFDG